MKHHYRLRVHYYDGIQPVTIPLVACETFKEAQEAWEKSCHRIHGKGYDHIKSVALLEGRKRPCFQRFSEGNML